MYLNIFDFGKMFNSTLLSTQILLSSLVKINEVGRRSLFIMNTFIYFLKFQWLRGESMTPGHVELNSPRIDQTRPVAAPYRMTHRKIVSLKRPTT